MVSFLASVSVYLTLKQALSNISPLNMMFADVCDLLQYHLWFSVAEHRFGSSKLK